MGTAVRNTIAILAVLAYTALRVHLVPAAEISSVTVDGTAFVVTLENGSVLRSPDLAGAVLIVATSRGQLRLRVDAVERDPDAVAGPVWLHSLSVAAADGIWRQLCDAGPDGRQQGFPLAFRPRQPDGAMEPAPPGVFDLICTAGARGKCVRFGYLPWQDDAMRDLYNACVRMTRADYCGDGEATTRDGTLIDIYDDRDIQSLDQQSAREFEAGWTAGGAVCVRHVRIKENVSFEILAQRCPRLKHALGVECTEERARSLGASLFNRSLP
jgi:ADYC domain-containing protein